MVVDQILKAKFPNSQQVKYLIGYFPKIIFLKWASQGILLFNFIKLIKTINTFTLRQNLVKKPTHYSVLFPL